MYTLSGKEAKEAKFRKLSVFVVMLVAFLPICYANDHYIVENLEQAYIDAVEDAKKLEENEICMSLIPIVESNENLTWWEPEPGDKRVLVLTFTSGDYSDSYGVGNTSTNSWGDVWVTVVPEVKEFIKNNPVSDEDLNLRIEQLLGLPPGRLPNAGTGSMAVELWVRPDDLFRPCPDSEITDQESQLNFPDNVSSDYSMWFLENLISAYYGEEFYAGRINHHDTGEERFPWTRLGYTYDWGNPDSDIGASEFVLKKGSEYIVCSKYHPICEYFKA